MAWNTACPAAAQADLLTLARDICPFPDYTPHPHFNQLLSVNSSAHLQKDYASVQAALTPEQRDAFTRRLRATFGREGKVTMGGVGVVALSLAVLFDILAKQVRGEWASPLAWGGLFKKELGGHHHVMVPVVNEYLRLVPHIANNPARMRDESERYYRKLHNLRLDRDRKEKFTDLEAVNGVLAGQFTDHLRLHLIRLTNLTEVRSIETSVFREKFGYVEGAGLERARRKRHGELRYRFSLNCDAEFSSKVFLAEVFLNDEYDNCKPQGEQRAPTVLHNIANQAVREVINARFGPDPHEDEMIAQTDNFDLKANALGSSLPI